jgi:hypothetical protein
VFCVVTYKSLRRADHSSRGVLPAVCDLETSTVRRPRPKLGCCATEKESEKRAPNKGDTRTEIHKLDIGTKN